MKIRLRYEVWEYHDGLSFRRASRAENERHRRHTEGVLRQVLYASSEADALAQYHELRGLEPVSPTDDTLHTPFTRAELEAQFADFPEDAALAAQMWPRLNRKDIQVADPDLQIARTKGPAPNRGAGALVWLLVIAAVLAAIAGFVWPGAPLRVRFDPAALPNPIERVDPAN
jgi:hypothetical protein